MFDSIFQLKVTGKHLLFFLYRPRVRSQITFIFHFKFFPLPYLFICAYVVSMSHLCLLDYMLALYAKQKNYVTFLHHIIVLLIRGRTKRNEKMFLIFFEFSSVRYEKNKKKLWKLLVMRIFLENACVHIHPSSFRRRTRWRCLPNCEERKIR